MNWYSRLELAVIDSELGYRDEAAGSLARAVELNPLEPVLITFKTRFAAGKTLTQTALDDVLAAQERATVGAR